MSLGREVLDEPATVYDRARRAVRCGLGVANRDAFQYGPQMCSIVLTGFLLQLALGGSSGVTVEEAVVYYEIEGSSARELRRALDHHRPPATTGEGFDAKTTWNVRWDYTLRSDRATCNCTDFRTTVQIEVVLPRWKQRAGASKLAKRWDQYLRGLTEHERGHAALAVRAAELIQASGADQKPLPTCPLLEESIRARADEILSLIRDYESEYDKKTRHGATQGASFP